MAALMRKAYLQMHLAIFLWGFTGILGKAINLSEGPIVWYRLLLTCISLLIIFTALGKIVRLPWRDLLAISGVGAIVTIHWLLFYAAIKYSNVSITLSCLASSALWTAMLEPVLLKNKKFDYKELIFGLIVVIGIYLIFHFEKLYTTGIVLALASAIAGAVFTIFNKRLLEVHTAESVVFYELLAGLALLTLCMPLYMWAFPQTTLLPPSGMDWLYLILLSVICTSFAFTLSLYALQRVSAFTMNLSVNLEPIYSIILAVIIFNEHELLHGGFYAGASVILLSVFVHAFFSYRKLRSGRHLGA